MSEIISIVNQKGGVGKTTTANNLATALVSAGKKVLVIDSDPQGNVTTSFGMNKSENVISLYQVLVEVADLEMAIQKTPIANLDIIVASISLAAAEIEMASLDNARHRLKEKLALVYPQYDYVIIDCPPSLGLLTINALVASHSIIIPLQCEFLALEGLSHLLQTFKLVKSRLNSELVINGIVLTMYDRRNNLTSVIEADVRNCLGDIVYQTVIPRNVRLSEAPSHGKPALLYDVSCAGSIAYIAMAKEFLERERIKEKVA